MALRTARQAQEVQVVAREEAAGMHEREVREAAEVERARLEEQVREAEAGRSSAQVRGKGVGNRVRRE